MFNPTAVVTLLGFKQLAQIAAGAFSIYLGFRLFGKAEQALQESGQIERGDFSAFLKAAPGTFFALFGATVIGLTIMHGGTVRYESDTPHAPAAAAPNPAAPAVPAKTPTEEFRPPTLREKFEAHLMG